MCFFVYKILINKIFYYRVEINITAYHHQYIIILREQFLLVFNFDCNFYLFYLFMIIIIILNIYMTNIFVFNLQN